MMTKTNTKKSSTMARVALGATAALALAGYASAAASTCTGGTGINTINNPVVIDGTADVCICATGYTDGANNKGAVGLTCTSCASGYYLSTGGGAASAGVCSQVPANKYFTTAAALTAAAEVPLACPANSYSAAGSSVPANCIVSPGYYLQVAATVVANAITVAPTITQITKNFYYDASNAQGVDGTAAQAAAVLTRTGFATGNGVEYCPYGGTSAAGATSLASCTPDCNVSNTDSNAIPLGGTCVCAAGTFQAAVPVDSAGTTIYAVVKNNAKCTPCTNTYTNAGAGVTTTTPNDAAITGATVSECLTAPGYYIDHPTGEATSLMPVQAPANFYAAGGSDLTSNYREVPTACPAHSTSAVGSSKISDCKCVAGYVSTASTCAPCAGRAAGDSVGTANTCAAAATAAAPAAATPAASGASSMSMFAAVAAVAAAQLVL